MVEIIDAEARCSGALAEFLREKWAAEREMADGMYALGRNSMRINHQKAIRRLKKRCDDRIAHAWALAALQGVTSVDRST